MILVLLGGGCLRDLDHPHPESVQVVVDALQKLQHLCPLFLSMFVCTSFLLANISLCISFRICLSAPLFCQILSFNAFFVSKCLSAPGLFEKSVLTGVVLLHKRPFNPTIPAYVIDDKMKKMPFLPYSSFIESLHVCVVT